MECTLDVAGQDVRKLKKDGLLRSELRKRGITRSVYVWAIEQRKPDGTKAVKMPELKPFEAGGRFSDALLVQQMKWDKAANVAFRLVQQLSSSYVRQVMRRDA